MCSSDLADAADAEGVTRGEYLRRLLEADVAEQVLIRATRALRTTAKRTNGRAVT